jgi:hypothetical protein
MIKADQKQDQYSLYLNTLRVNCVLENIRFYSTLIRRDPWQIFFPRFLPGNTYLNLLMRYRIRLMIMLITMLVARGK